MTSNSRQAGGGTLFTEPVLVVHQKARLVEAASEFGVFDRHGRPLGAVVEVGQSFFRKLLRVLTKYDKYLTHKFEVRDVGGSVVLKVTRPAKMLVFSGSKPPDPAGGQTPRPPARFVVTRADGTPIGEVVQENVFDRIRFAFVAGERQLGGIEAENWRAWNFSITDSSGTEVARVTKTFAGVLKEAFSTADNYVVEVYRQLAEPLASMVVASALTIDTALKQDEHD